MGSIEEVPDISQTSEPVRPDLASPFGKEQILSSRGMDAWFKQLVDSRDEYPEHRERLMQKLRSFEAATPENIRFGPEYVFSGERPMTISTLFFDYADTADSSHRDFCLIAKDDAGNLIGDAYWQTTLQKRLRRIENNGVVVVDQKGKGGAMPINLALWNVLQLEANGKNIPLDWTIHNSNAESLAALEGQYKKTQDPALRPKIADMRKQQERWQAIYGVGGKLGINKDGIKRLMPKDEEPYEDLESIRSIDLKRIDDEDDRAYPKVASYELAKDPQALRDERLKELRAFITTL